MCPRNLFSSNILASSPIVAGRDLCTSVSQSYPQLSRRCFFVASGIRVQSIGIDADELGTDGISGCSPDIDRDADEVSSVGKEVADDEEEDRRMFDKAQQMTTKETELAQQSDLKPAATSGQSALKASSQRHHQSHEEERPTKSAKLGSVHDGEEGQRMSQFDKARMITKETEVAQQFDLKLTREICLEGQQPQHTLCKSPRGCADGTQGCLKELWNLCSSWKQSRLFP